MSREVPEWIGKTDDTPVPDRVKARVFLAHGGICHIAKRKIKPGEAWDAEHVKAIINGGENRESNLAPALRERHKEKTAADMAEKSMIYRKRKKHLGIKKPSRMPGSRHSRFKKKIDGSVVLRDAR
jgi:5-methylcytosine-specific restriction protein A